MEKAAQESNDFVRKITKFNKSTTIWVIIKEDMNILKRFVTEFTIIFSVKLSFF